MSIDVLTSGIPVISIALEKHELLPPRLSTSLHNACFALVSILNLELDKDVLEVVREYDFKANGLPYEIDPDCLEIVVESLGELGSQKGSYLPESDILAEIANSPIVDLKRGKLEVSGERSGAIIYYGSEFLLLNGKLIVDTEAGRINSVLEILPSHNKAIIEVADPKFRQDPEHRLLALINGKPITSVGNVIPNSFQHLTFNHQGNLQGIYLLHNEAYLFQGGETLPLDIEGRVVKAQFLKDSNLPSGVITTDKYIYLIDQGVSVSKINLKIFAKPEDVSIQADLVKNEEGSKVYFWGSMFKDGNKIPFFNSPIVSFAFANKEDSKPKFLDCFLNKQPHYYQGKLYFEALIDEQLHFCILSTHPEKKFEVKAFNKLHDEVLSSFQPLEDFHKNGNALVRTAGTVSIVYNGELIGHNLIDPYLMDKECRILDGSVRCFPRLLASETGWTIIKSNNEIFNLHSAYFPQSLSLPIGIHVTKDLKLTCLSGVRGQPIQKLFFCDEVFSLGENLYSEQLIGVYEDKTGHKFCLLKAEDKVFCLMFKGEINGTNYLSCAKYDSAIATEIGIIGNLDSKTLIIDGYTFEDLQLVDLTKVNTHSGILYLVQTNVGTICLREPSEDISLNLEYHVEADAKGNTLLIHEHKDVRFGFKFLS